MVAAKLVETARPMMRMASNAVTMTNAMGYLNSFLRIGPLRAWYHRKYYIVVSITIRLEDSKFMRTRSTEVFRQPGEQTAIAERRESLTL